MRWGLFQLIAEMATPRRGPWRTGRAVVPDSLRLPATPETRYVAFRIASAAIGLPLLIIIVWVGSPWFSVLVAMVAALGALELSDMARRWRDQPALPLAMACGAGLIVAGHFLAEASPAWHRALPVASVAAGVSATWLLWHSRGFGGPSRWAVTAAIAVFIGGLLLHAPLLRALPQGREWMLFLLSVSFATDTCAFLTGKAVGKTPLAPSLSPSKTWEGAIGGLAGALGASVAATAVLSLDYPVGQALALGAIIGTVAQLGDLVESRLKRNSRLKNSGWLVPGHGGILDRLDSIVFSLVVVYYFVS